MSETFGKSDICMRAFFLAATCVASVAAAGEGSLLKQGVKLDRYPGEEMEFSISLDELVSARGEEEHYAPCDMTQGDIGTISACEGCAGFRFEPLVASPLFAACVSGARAGKGR